MHPDLFTHSGNAYSITPDTNTTSKKKIRCLTLFDHYINIRITPHFTIIN